jgi:GxxExxY protein
LSERKPRPIPARALRHGLTLEVLEDRVCSEVIDAAYAVHEGLGVMHAAQTYKRALVTELSSRGLTCHKDATFSVVFKGRVVGSFDADVLVENRVLVQVATDPHLTAERKTETVRGLAAGGVKVGLVFNFGAPELFFARIL